LVEISNILTLRYDPSSYSSNTNSLAEEKPAAGISNRIKHVTPAEISGSDKPLAMTGTNYQRRKTWTTKLDD